MRLTARIRETLAAIGVVTLALTVAAAAAMAQGPVIDITKGQVKPVPIAVTDFVG